MHQVTNVQFERAVGEFRPMARGAGAGSIAGPGMVVGPAFEVLGVQQPDAGGVVLRPGTAETVHLSPMAPRFFSNRSPARRRCHGQTVFRGKARHPDPA